MRDTKTSAKKQLFKTGVLFATSAVSLTVIQPPFNLSALAWISMVPLILACSPQAKARGLAVAAYLVSLAYWLGNLYWMSPITVVGWVAFCLYTALLWPVLGLALRWCRSKKLPLFLASAILVVGTEQMQGLFLGGFLWRLLGHSQWQNTTIIQIADIFGAGGVSFLVAMVNGLLAELIIAASNKKLFQITQFVKVAIVSMALLATILYGRWRIAQTEDFVQPGPLVASLQSNVPQSVKRTFEKGQQIFDELMVHSRSAAKAGAELIVWPETMVQATLSPEVQGILDPAHEWKILDQKLKMHAKGKAYLLVGAYGGRPNREGTELVERYNSAFMYRPDGTLYEKSYNKIHLVPFGEVLPFRKTLPGLYKLLMRFTPYNYDYSLDYGSRYTVFEMAGSAGQELPAYRFAVIICYEDVVPYLARNFALDDKGRKRVDWLVNISNDGWFVRFEENSGRISPSTELPQHAAVCVFRAVENRLAIIRSVNTGISCLIDSVGNIRDGFAAGTLPEKAMNRTGMAGWFADKMPIDRRVTFFSKYGPWLDFCCEACVISSIILPILARLLGAAGFGTRLSGKSNGRQSQRTRSR